MTDLQDFDPLFGNLPGWVEEELAEKIRVLHMQHVDRELAKRKRPGPLQGDQRTAYSNGVLMGARLAIEATLLPAPPSKPNRYGIKTIADWVAKSEEEEPRRLEHLRQSVKRRQNQTALRRFVTPAVLKAITKPEPLNRMDAPG